MYQQQIDNLRDKLNSQPYQGNNTLNQPIPSAYVAPVANHVSPFLYGHNQYLQGSTPYGGVVMNQPQFIPHEFLSHASITADATTIEASTQYSQSCVCTPIQCACTKKPSAPS